MKLAEMNGFPGLLQSTLSIPEEDNMFLRSSSSNVTSVFINWSKEGNCFEEGKKLQLLNKKAPAIVNSIDNALILTGVGINAFIKSVNKYLDLMLYLPLAADLVFSKLLNLVDFYIYAVTTLFSPTGLLNTLFVQTDGAAIYPYIVPFIKRCQLIFFPPQQQEEEPESSTPSDDQLTPLSPITPEQEETLDVLNGIIILTLQLPDPVLTVDESLLSENIEIRRIIAAESTRLFSALFAAIDNRVQSLAPISKNEIIRDYIKSLPEITQDLCKMFYRCSSNSILHVYSI